MSMGKWKEREKEQRRNDIINAARKFFADKDFDEVSMDKIAEDIGLGKSTLYLYFKNKEALYFAIELRGIQIWVQMVKEEIEKGATGLEKLKLYINATKKFSKKYPNCLRMLYSPTNNKNQFDTKKLDSSEEFKEVKALFKELRFIGMELIQIGIDDGEIGPDVDPAEAIILLSVIINGSVNMGSWSKEILENKGIKELKFTNGVGDLFLNMLTENIK
jgi:TetR/AcrR family transcriptional regulator